MSWRMMLASVFALAAFVLLVFLGTWQMRRLAWKEDLIAKIEARVQAPPVALPDEATWGALKADDYEYRHVTLRGTFEHDKELLIFRASGPHEGVSQPGYVVMTPLRLDTGASVLIARGFVTEAFKEATKRPQGQISGPVTLSGVMRAPEPRNAFTPADSPEKGLWYTRDPAAMAAKLGLVRSAPFSIDADATPVPGGWPKAGVTVIAIKNDHLSYALTWYGLALTLLIFVGFMVWRNRKKN